jgi:hypothetical protein
MLDLKIFLLFILHLLGFFSILSWGKVLQPTHCVVCILCLLPMASHLRCSIIVDYWKGGLTRKAKTTVPFFPVFLIVMGARFLVFASDSRGEYS